MERLTILLTATALLAAAWLGWLLLSPADPVAEQLATAGIAVDLPVAATPVRVSAPDGVLAEGIYSVGTDRLRVRVSPDLDAKAGADLAAEERSLILGLFEDHQAPYPGALAHTLRCAPEFEPTDIEPRGAAAFLLTVYANDRYAYGGCAQDLLTFRSTVGAFYDEARHTLVRIEYFEPKGAPPHGPDVVRSLRWVTP